MDQVEQKTSHQHKMGNQHLASLLSHLRVCACNYEQLDVFVRAFIMKTSGYVSVVVLRSAISVGLP